MLIEISPRARAGGLAVAHRVERGAGVGEHDRRARSAEPTRLPPTTSEPDSGRLALRALDAVDRGDARDTELSGSGGSA